MMRKTLVRLQALPVARAAPLAGLLLVGLWAYWPTLAAMGHKWLSDPQYSHGYLVPAFSLYLLWQRRARLANAHWEIDWRGLPLLFVGVALRFAAAYAYFDWLDAVSLLPTLAGTCVLFGGKSALDWAWPAIAFLLFMVPLPFRVETALGLPLQRLATLCSTYILQTLGLPALAEGNTILLPSGPIGVAEACSGLSMMLIFFALSTALVILVHRPRLDKAIILLSSLPIALLVNMIRIAATGVAQEEIGPQVAHAIFHDAAGWLMMPLALGLLALELWLLARLLPEVQASRPLAPVRPVTVAPRSAGNVANGRRNKGRGRNAHSLKNGNS
jgi:exosortase